MFEALGQRFAKVFSGLRGQVNESELKNIQSEISTALIDSDVSVEVAKSFSEAVYQKASEQIDSLRKSVNPYLIIQEIVNQELINILGGNQRRMQFSKKPPTIILLMGLQGSGKTSFAGKLARHLKSSGNTPLLVAADLARPNAVDQLKIIGEQVNVPVFAPELGNGVGEPILVAKESIKIAQDKLHNFVIVDTAGRLAIDTALINELNSIKAQINPTETFFVLDAMLGQSAADVAEKFQSQVGFDAVVLTKLDGDAKGGAALSVVTKTGKPIIFSAVGEKPDDLESFYPDRIASRILGRGDIATLAEKTAAAVPTELNEKLTQKIASGQEFTLTDFLAQLAAIKNMGSISKLMGLIPGMNAKMQQQVSGFDDAELVRTRAIIESMTPAERENPNILNGSRRARIAKGSGRAVSEINRLVDRFSQAQKMMKQMKNNPLGTANNLPGLNMNIPNNISLPSPAKRKKSRSGNPAKRALEENQ